MVNFRMLCGHLPFQDQAATHPMLAQSFEENIKRHILAGRIIFRNRDAWPKGVDACHSGGVAELICQRQRLGLEALEAGCRRATLCTGRLKACLALPASLTTS